jgi:predicted TPR repeat methyltransferase
MQQVLYNEFFDYIANQYESLIDISRNLANIDTLLELLSHEIGGLVDKRIIDFGCGTGLASRRLRGAAAEFTGVDQSPHMRDIAMHRGMKVVPTNDLASWTSYFDGAIASYVLHLLSDDEALRSLALALKPDGVLVGNFHKNANLDRVTKCLARYGCEAVELPLRSGIEIHGGYMGYRKS